jgi:hypothetical protein
VVYCAKKRLPVASPIVTASAASDSATASSPACVRFDRRSSSADGSTDSAPVSRARSTSRADSTDQLSKSQAAWAIRHAIGSQPRPSSRETAPVRNSSRACRNIGTPAE